MSETTLELLRDAAKIIQRVKDSAQSPDDLELRQAAEAWLQSAPLEVLRVPQTSQIPLCQEGA
jgi:hypothetical protein